MSLLDDLLKEARSLFGEKVPENREGYKVEARIETQLPEPMDVVGKMPDKPYAVFRKVIHGGVMIVFLLVTGASIYGYFGDLKTHRAPGADPSSFLDSFEIAPSGILIYDASVQRGQVVAGPFASGTTHFPVTIAPSGNGWTPMWPSGS